jgi:Cys/Met metabolism PLP-dependent enzyme
MATTEEQLGTLDFLTADSGLENARFDTLALHAGTYPDPTTGAILTPIYQTTTYRQEAVGKDKGFTYSRASNPTVSALERKLARPRRRHCVLLCSAREIVWWFPKPYMAAPCGCFGRCLNDSE